MDAITTRGCPFIGWLPTMRIFGDRVVSALLIVDVDITNRLMGSVPMVEEVPH